MNVFRWRATAPRSAELQNRLMRRTVFMNDRRLAEHRFHSPASRATFHRCVCWLAAVVVFVSVSVAQAATFITPQGPLPNGCSQQGTTIDCTQDVQLGQGDQWQFTSGSAITLDMNGNSLSLGQQAAVNPGGNSGDLSVEDASSVTLSQSAELVATIAANGDVSMGQSSSIGGAVTSSGGSVTVGEKASVAGALSADAAVTLQKEGNVAGPVSAGGDVSMGQSSSVSGDVTSSGGSVTVGKKSNVGGALSAAAAVTVQKQASVTGGVTAGGDVSTGKSSSVGGDLTSTGGSVTVGEKGSIGGVLSADGTATIQKEGTVSGDVSAGGNASLGEKGLVQGDVQTGGDLVVKQDAVIEGCVTVGGTLSNNGLIKCAQSDAPLVEYRMEETVWNGTAGEVADETANGYDGTARNGPATSNTTPDPAIPGDPGTCRYGGFDGSDDYVELPGFPDLESSFTITGWFRTRNNAEAGQRIFADDENNNDGYAVSVGDGGKGRVRFYHRALSPISLDTPAVIQNDTWYFVGAVLDEQAKKKHIYIYDSAGNLVDHTQGSFTGNLQTDGGTASIGGETASGETGNRFDGQLDEIRVYDSALTESGIEAINQATHPCPKAPTSECAADFAVHAANGLKVENNVQVNGNTVRGSGNSIEPDTGQRVDATRPLPALDPSTFPSFTANQEITVAKNGSRTIAADDYKKIELKKNAEATLDTSNGQDFRIKELKAEKKNNVLNLQPGRYFVKEFELGEKADLNLLGSGEVEIFVKKKFQIKEQATLNSGGNPRDLTINLYSEAEFSTETRVKIVGTVYAPNSNKKLQFGEQNAFTGGVFSGGEIEFKKKTKITYKSQAEQAGRQAAGCTGGPDHYAIDVGGNPASTCRPRTITITAEDSGNNTITDYTGVVDITTSSGHGDWRKRDANGDLTDPADDDDGVARYEYVTGDNGSIDLDLDNQHADDLTITVTEDDGSPSSTSATLSFRHNAFIIEPRSTLPYKANDDIVAGLDQPFQATLVRREPANPSGQCKIATNYNDASQDVKLWIQRNSEDPGGANPEEATTNTTLPDTKPGAANVTLDFSSASLSQAGRAPLTLATTDVGKYALAIEDTTFAEDATGGGSPTPRPINGSTADLVVRPFGLRVTAADNPAASDATEPAYRTAGTSTASGSDARFEVTVSAVRYDSRDDSDDNGLPDGHADADPPNKDDLSNNAITPSFGQEDPNEDATVTASLWRPTGTAPDGTSPNDPGLANGPVTYTGQDFLTGTSGQQTQATAFNEVGIIELEASVADGDYLGSGEPLEGRSGPVGRFHPDRLRVTTTQQPAFMPEVSSAFTYMDQAFGYDAMAMMRPQVTVEALSADGSTVLDNYGGQGLGDDADFWLLAGTPGRSYSDASGATTNLAPDQSGGSVTWDLGAGDTRVDYDGQATFRIQGDRFTYERVGPAPAERQQPFPAAVNLEIPASDLNDGDACFDPGDDGTCDAFRVDGDTSTPAADPIGGTELRYGRLIIDDAFGPEIAPVDQQWRIEYWEGDTWRLNQPDSATRIDLADDTELEGDGTTVAGDQPVELTNGGGATTEIVADALQVNDTDGDPAPEEIVFDSGTAGVRYSAPDARGWIDVRTLLSSRLPYLQFDLDGDGALDDSPAARVTFGVFAGESEHIYLREVFPAP